MSRVFLGGGGGVGGWWVWGWVGGGGGWLKVVDHIGMADCLLANLDSLASPEFKLVPCGPKPPS